MQTILTAQEWVRLQEIFDAAVELPPDNRASYLDETCKDDPALRLEIESLLRAVEEDTGFHEPIGWAAASSLRGSLPTIGDRLGPYQITGVIGQGGMGVVYRAVRADDEYNKEVAIKVAAFGLSTPGLRQRFLRERQILANLDHPYIARLLDGGTTVGGFPFFVMEYVKGWPMDVFCRERELSNRARCELFLRVLEAVSYAHRNLVVHLDLKPSNVLVTADGNPKLLDFGVAKLLSGNLDPSRTATITTLGLFTPEYSSPEQVCGLPVTTATDVYSLGVIFYELLTDRRAQPISIPNPDEVRRIVCRGEPCEPSQIVPSVDADLDKIVLMAMRKESERRYQSVDQFAEDIRRHLEGKPVLARQDSLSYRAGKFVRRNRLQIGAIALVLASLSVGLVVSIGQARRAQAALRVAESQRLIAVREKVRAEALQLSEAAQQEKAEQQTVMAEEQRDLAQKERAVAERGFMDSFNMAYTSLLNVQNDSASLLGASFPDWVSERKRILERTLRFLDQIQEEQGETGLDDQMRTALAGGYYQASQIQWGSFPSLGDAAGSQVSLRKAQAIILPVYRKNSGDAGVVHRWIDIQLGLTSVARAVGRQHETFEIGTDLMPVAHHLDQIANTTWSREEEEALVELDRARLYRDKDDPHDLEHANRAVELLRTISARYPDAIPLKFNLALAYSYAGDSYRARVQSVRAAENYRQSIQLYDGLIENQPSSVHVPYGMLVRRNLLGVYESYASLLGFPLKPNLGDPALARKSAQRAAGLALGMIQDGSDREDVNTRLADAASKGLIAELELAPNNPSASLKDVQIAFDLMGRVAKDQGLSPGIALQQAYMLERWGMSLEAMEHQNEAIEIYRKSLDVLQPFLESDNRDIVQAAMAIEQDLALAEASTGNNVVALELAGRSVRRAKDLSAKNPKSALYVAKVAESYATLAAVQEKAGDLEQARQNAGSAIALWGPARDLGLVHMDAAKRADTVALLSRLGSAKATIN